jgi:hypothetical protein
MCKLPQLPDTSNNVSLGAWCTNYTAFLHTLGHLLPFVTGSYGEV